MRTVLVFLVLALQAPALRAEEGPAFDGVDVQGWADRLAKNGWGPHMKALAAGGEGAIPILGALLDHEDPSVREQAARAVCWMHEAGRPLLARLLRLVDDPDEDVREAAVDGLGNLGDEVAVEVVPLLREVLREGGRGVVFECTRALGRYGAHSKHALPELLLTLFSQKPGKFNVEMTAEAIWAIGEAGGEALVEACRSPTQDATQSALLAEALGFGGDAAIPYVSLLLRDEAEATAAVAEEACLNLSWRALPLLDVLRRVSGRVGERANRATSRLLREGVLRRAVKPEEDQVRELVPGPSVDPRAVNLIWECGEDRHNYDSYDFLECKWRDGNLHVTRFPWVGRHPVARYAAAPRSEVHFGAAHAVVPGFRAAAALRMALAATGLRLAEKPSDPSLGLKGGSCWFQGGSSFQIRMRFESVDGVVYEEDFEGCVSSMDKEDYIRLEVAQEVMEELIEDARWEPRPIKEPELARLHERCADLAEENRRVRGCLLRVVSQLGDERFLPVLEAWIRQPLDRVPYPHIHAINAYARLTGVDLREGKVTWDNVREVRERYLEHLEAAPASEGQPSPQDD